MSRNTIQEYTQILEHTNRLALATAIDQVPNVRIVNFVYDASRPGILYFTSDRDNRKVTEFTLNNQVAFTVIPEQGIAHIRSSQAVVRKSDLTLGEIKELFIAKVPGYDETLKAIGEMLEVFEIQMKEATVVTGFDEPAVVHF
ncbi:pyridoxamine 5'-phosphate oxidase family protein [Paenibacillus donghaensis]|uniref:Pyridoxamine 5'-phosphate oxidase-like domain-containing protein n=1 Tax=Paenibacillus donghaensis TaxID=414771 RepID=A0A2Z2KIK3_9BACL|nr:pyridoxamine 5'-phosphate oxidase family protein [Paenibacillus donghaensis]ASA23050.1 hypothetical protein B9T62_20910 [Paenibacillus donghaensis]